MMMTSMIIKMMIMLLSYKANELVVAIMAEATSACRPLPTRQYESIQQLQLLMVDIDHKGSKSFNRFSNVGDGSLNMDQLWGDQAHQCYENGVLENLDSMNPGQYYMTEQSNPVRQNIPLNEKRSKKESEITSVVKQHPSFQRLVRAHYSCRKVGSSFPFSNQEQ